MNFLQFPYILHCIKKRFLTGLFHFQVSILRWKQWGSRRSSALRESKGNSKLGPWKVTDIHRHRDWKGPAPPALPHLTRKDDFVSLFSSVMQRIYRMILGDIVCVLLLGLYWASTIRMRELLCFPYWVKGEKQLGEGSHLSHLLGSEIYHLSTVPPLIWLSWCQRTVSQGNSWGEKRR